MPEVTFMSPEEREKLARELADEQCSVSDVLRKPTDKKAGYELQLRVLKKHLENAPSDVPEGDERFTAVQIKSQIQRIETLLANLGK